MAEKRALEAALSANHGLEDSHIFMTMWQSIWLMSLDFSMPFWQGENSFGHVGNCPYLCSVFQREGGNVYWPLTTPEQ